MKFIKIIILFITVFFLTVNIPAIEIGINPRFSKRYKTALVNNAVFSSDSKLIATTSTKMVQLWDVQTGKLVANIHTFKKKPMAIAFSGNTKMLIAGAWGGKNGSKVKVWNIKSRTLVTNLASTTEISSVALSHDASMAAIASTLLGDKNKMSITLWDTKTGKRIATLKKKRSEAYYPTSLLFTKDGRYLINAVSNRDHGVEVWDLKTRKRKTYIKTKLDVTVIALDPDEKKLAIGMHVIQTRKRKASGSIGIYDLASSKKLYELKKTKAHITSLSFHPNGKFLASGIFSSRPNYIIWDLRKRKIHFQKKKGRRPALKTLFSNDGKSLAIVLNTYGNLGNPDTFKVFDIGSKADLKKSGASNDINTFRIGSRVKAVIDGKTYTGTVNKKSKHHYLLKMDNRRPEYWKWVEPGNLRPK